MPKLVDLTTDELLVQLIEARAALREAEAAVDPNGYRKGEGLHHRLAAARRRDPDGDHGALEAEHRRRLRAAGLARRRVWRLERRLNALDGPDESEREDEGR